MLTNIWRIQEAPQYEIELTSWGWVLWGKSCPDEDCLSCGGIGEKIIDSCGFVRGTTLPADKDMITKATGLTKWTPERIL